MYLIHMMQNALTTLINIVRDSDGANHGEAKKMAPYFHPFSIADFKKYLTL